MCGLEITLENGTIQSIKGDKDDPFSKGYICPKATALQDLHEDPDRLRKPIKKVNGEWKEIEWKEAFDLFETKIKSIQKKFGKDALGIYQGNPNVHNIGSMLFGIPFARSLKTKYKYSATSVDQLPHHYAAQFMMGHLLLIPIPDINRTDFFLCLGANPVVSNGSLMSAGGMPQRIKELQSRGGKFVVIDPRKTQTAEKADQHLFIRPGTDVYFLAAFIQVLFQEKMIVADLPDYTKGLEGLGDLFSPFTPEKTESITGISSEETRKIVKTFVESRTAVCYGRMGLSVQEHGTLCQWMINLINILTGNFDQPGGAMFTSPAIDPIKLGRKGTYHKYNRWQSRVRKLPEFNGELPVASLAEDILAEGEGQIKAMITVAGNPVLSTPNGSQLEKAFESLEFMVAIDIYLNETTKHADLILPTTSGLENEHYDVVFNTLAIHNVAKYSPPLFEAPKGLKSDWEVFKELTQRLQPPSLMEKAMNPLINPTFMLKQGLKASGSKVTVQELKKSPHGIDLGPLKSCLPQRLMTEDNQLDLAPELFVTALKKLTWNKGQEKLLLIGRRQLRSNNSWMHNSTRLVKGPERCTLIMHPEDAQSRAIEDGQYVKVRSRTGTVEIKAVLSDEMMQGVVSIPHGWGHHRSGTRWRTAEAHAGTSLNDITDDQQIDEVCGNAALSAVPVEVMV